jgi:hypothetical protein
MAQQLIQAQPWLKDETLAELKLMLYQFVRCTAKFLLKD